jgi:hypothetical protein
MKKILLITVLGLILFGCKSYVQVFKTNSSVETDADGFYVYENDSLKITYSFWNAKGLMTFSIFNKLDKPLYIDWKKSSYIDNSVKLNYWVDEEKTKGLSAYGSYYYDGPLLKPGYAISSKGGASISSTVKVERITFIPPSSNYYRSQFYILPINFFKLDTKTEFDEVPRKDKPKKKTKVYKATFTKEKSPLVFRNFLTFSLSEDFVTEFYVDNEFYIQQVLEMDKRHFEQYRYDDDGKWYIKDENGNPILFSDFQSPSSFYLKIKKNVESIESRILNSRF